MKIDKTSVVDLSELEEIVPNRKRVNKKKCCISRNEIDGLGNNPSLVYDFGSGSYCDDCNRE